MVSRSDRRRLQRMQREREKEIKKEENKNIRTAAIAGAAAVGIGFVAYQNKDEIVDQVASFVSKNSIRLNRATQSKGFRGKIEETKNVSRAFTDTYTKGSPQNIIRGITDRKEKAKEFNARLDGLNKAVDERVNKLVPDDVKSAIGTLSKMRNTSSENSKKAFSAALQDNLHSVMQKKEFQKAFGDKTGDVEKLFREKPEILRNMGKVQTEANVPLSIVRGFAENNLNPDSAINFNIKNEEKRNAFMQSMFQAAKEAQTTTKKQQDEFTKAMKHSVAKASEDNAFAKYKNLYDVVSFEGLRESQAAAGDSFVNKALRKEGFNEVTMGDAKDLYVQFKDGKMYGTKEKTEGAKRFDEVFSSTIKEKERDIGFADRFIETGKQMGITDKELFSTRYSNDLHMNKETGEILSSTASKELFEEGLDFLQGNFQVPMIRVNPLDLTNRRARKQQRNTPGSAIYEKGWVSSFTNQAFMEKDETHALKKSYIHIGNKIYDGDVANELTGNLRPDEAYEKFKAAIGDHQVAEGFEISNVKTGVRRRHAEALSGRSSINPANQNPIKRALKLNQENESNFDRLGRFLTKGQNPNSARNIMATTRQETDVTENIAEIHDKLNATVRGLSSESEASLHETIVDMINTTNAGFEFEAGDMQTEEGLARIAEGIYRTSKPQKPQTVGGAVKEHVKNRIGSTYNWNEHNPDGLFDRTGYLRDKNVFKTPLRNAVDDDISSQIDGKDMLKRQIEQYGIALANENGIDLKEVLKEKGATKKAANEVDDLMSLNISSFFAKEAKDTESFDDIAELNLNWKTFFGQETPASDLMQGSLNRAEPKWSAGVSPRKDPLLGETEFMPIKTYQSPLKAINEAYSESAGDQPGDGRFAEATRLATAVVDWTKETGAGGIFRGTDGDVTTRHSGMWNIADNLDKRLQNWGLGLPNDKKGSIASIMGNQFAYRIAMPYIGFQYAKYVDDMTGGNISKGLAKTYANMSIDVAETKEALGINNQLRTAEKLMPYMEHAKEWAPVKLANAATLGALTESRSGEELTAYYESGEDPVRKGAYWGIASSTPWMGSRIDYHRPNWYRRTMSDWQYTDTKFGSRSEYWNNHWLPTPTAPWAPLNRYFLDPYHYENKHENSRPYAMTGGYEELRMIPLVGPAVDGVVSSVLKPQREHKRLEKSHRQYLTQENERIASAYMNMNAGGSVSTTPSGSLALHSDQYVVEFTDEDGMLDEDRLYADSVRFANETKRMGSGEGGANAVTQGDALKRATREMQEGLAQFNQGITAHKDPVQTQMPGEAGNIYKPTTVQSLNDVVNPNSLLNPKGVWEEMYFNAGGFAGLRGFLSRSVLGYRPNDTRTQYLQTSDRFNDYSRQFWQSGWGGFGGDLSEIFRRYVQNPQRTDHYNPIRNEMPDWINLMFSINSLNCWEPLTSRRGQSAA